MGVCKNISSLDSSFTGWLVQIMSAAHFWFLSKDFRLLFRELDIIF
jgi:hypothetical protein